MQRKITFYANKIIIPYFVFYVVTLFTYLVPPDAGEKKSYSTSILISAIIYLKDISYYIPKTIVLPLLSIYFNLNFVFVFVCLVFSTVIYAVYYLDKTKRSLPSCLLRLVSARSNKFYLSDEIFKRIMLNKKKQIHHSFNRENRSQDISAHYIKESRFKAFKSLENQITCKNFFKFLDYQKK
jgi:hypothetical protein